MYPTIDNDLYHSCDGGLFFLRKEFYKNTTNVYKIKYMPKKWNENYDIFFGQFRGASFTSFFNTYNLTKY